MSRTDDEIRADLIQMRQYFGWYHQEDVLSRLVDDADTLLDRAQAAEAKVRQLKDEYGEFVFSFDCTLSEPHPQTLCRCEYSHTCIWCTVDALRARINRLTVKNKQLDEIRTLCLNAQDTYNAAYDLATDILTILNQP